MTFLYSDIFFVFSSNTTMNTYETVLLGYCLHRHHNLFCSGNIIGVISRPPPQPQSGILLILFQRHRRRGQRGDKQPRSLLPCWKSHRAVNGIVAAGMTYGHFHPSIFNIVFFPQAEIDNVKILQCV